jgi:hypothetical protein
MAVEPYHDYERTQKETEITLQGVSPDKLAAVTDHLYFQAAPPAPAIPTEVARGPLPRGPGHLDDRAGNAGWHRSMMRVVFAGHPHGKAEHLLDEAQLVPLWRAPPFVLEI